MVLFFSLQEISQLSEIVCNGVGVKNSLNFPMKKKLMHSYICGIVFMFLFDMACGRTGKL